MKSGLLDEDVKMFMAEQSRRTAEEFGQELGPSSPPLLEWGNRAEFRPVTADGIPRIFVKRRYADWWRIRYQIAHELFHWLCTPPGTFHWTHELFAVEMAVRAMQELGEHDYVRRETERLAAEAELLSVSTMLVTPFGDVSPAGLYGRAWVTGRALIDVIGWERLKSLARSFDEDGRPDVANWVRALPQRGRAGVEGVLGRPSKAWV
jgi:hypothetical protein